MKIAMIAAPIERIPPTKYGGTERVVSALTEELVKMGHDVTLFASANSKTTATLVGTFPKPLRETFPRPADAMKRMQTTLIHLSKAYSRQDEFDIIHDHTSYFGMSYAQISKTPVVATLHSELNKENVDMYKQFDKPFFVSISDAQRNLGRQLGYIATVHNGLDMRHYPYAYKHKNYLLAVGRFSPEKGMHNAITIAKKLKMPLIIAAKLEDKFQDYFAQKIKPFLNDSIRWVGEVSEKQRNELMRHARCFMHPLEWEEPFGLTIIESMACGTPVVAFNKGSMPEIIQHGKSGFLAKTLPEMMYYIKQVDRLDRQYCRAYSLNNFSSRMMARGYEAVYESVLSLQRYPYSWLFQPAVAQI